MARGTIAFEEAFLDPSHPEVLESLQHLLTPSKQDEKSSPTESRFKALLEDIHGTRLKEMDAEGVDFMVLSLTSPGVQGEGDVAKAEEMAFNSNNYLATQVRMNPTRFGGLAALSMHNPSQAAHELTRAVKQLGMYGGLVNDYQSIQGEEKKKKFFDTPDYDIFWQTVEQLDVPIYFHPRYPAASEYKERWATRQRLIGAGVSFHLDLSYHIYAICSSGIFDRFPKVQIVAGHLGEGVPFNLWRASHWYNKPFKKSVRLSVHDYKFYFQNNVHVTTSGNFNTPALKFCINELGLDRVLYSIDYPYETIKEAQDWWKSVDLPTAQRTAISRTNAIKLLKLPFQE